MTTVTMEIPGDMLSVLRRSPDEFMQELRCVAHLWLPEQVSRQVVVS